jgi:hypothetical protein
MLRTTTDEDAVTDGSPLGESARGGVVNLLRMAKVHCGAGVAFAALGPQEQTVSIASYPDPSGPALSDASWDVALLVELVRRAWALPDLSVGRAVAGTWEPSGPRPAPSTPTRASVAAVPLCDETDPQRPWGLLCVAKEDGAFDEEQLGVLRDLGRRLTAYLRARQTVLTAPKGALDHRPAPAVDETPAPGDPEAARALLDYLGDALDDEGAGHRAVAVLLFGFAHAGASGGGPSASADAIAEVLRQHVRQDDVVVALDDALIGVGLATSSERVQVEAVRDRLRQVAASASSTSSLEVAMALAPVGTSGPEELLGEAAARLGQR